MILRNNLDTIQDFIRLALTEFEKNNIYCGHGTDNTWDEAIALVTHTLNLENHVENFQLLLSAKLLTSEQDLLFSNWRAKIKFPCLFN